MHQVLRPVLGLGLLEVRPLGVGDLALLDLLGLAGGDAVDAVGEVLHSVAVHQENLLGVR